MIKRIIGIVLTVAMLAIFAPMSFAADETIEPITFKDSFKFSDDGTLKENTTSNHFTRTDWAEYKVTVPKTGTYTIYAKATTVNAENLDIKKAIYATGGTAAISYKSVGRLELPDGGGPYWADASVVEANKLQIGLFEGENIIYATNPTYGGSGALGTSFVLEYVDDTVPAQTKAALDYNAYYEKSTSNNKLLESSTTQAYVNQGDWLEYKLNVAESGSYLFTFNGMIGSDFTLSFKRVAYNNETPILWDMGASLTIPDQNGPSSYGYPAVTFDNTVTLDLAEGENIIQISFSAATADDLYMFDTFDYLRTGDLPATQILTANTSNVTESYNKEGSTLGAFKPEEWLKLAVYAFKAGTYNVKMLDRYPSSDLAATSFKLSDESGNTLRGTAKQSEGWSDIVETDVLGTLSLKAGLNIVTIEHTGQGDFQFDGLKFEGPTAGTEPEDPYTITGTFAVGQTVSFEIEEAGAKVYAVAYQDLGSGKMMMLDSELASTSGNTHTATLTIPATATVVKFFVWDANYNPIMEYVSKDVQ